MLSLKEYCGGDYVNISPSNAECTMTMNTYNEMVLQINVLNILVPNCKLAKPRKIEGRRFLADLDPIDIHFTELKNGSAYWNIIMHCMGYGLTTEELEMLSKLARTQHECGRGAMLPYLFKECFKQCAFSSESHQDQPLGSHIQAILKPECSQSLEELHLGEVSACEWSIRAVKDQWLARPTSFKPVTFDPGGDLRVSALIDWSRHGWDLTKLNHTSLPIDQEALATWAESFLMEFQGTLLVWQFVGVAGLLVWTVGATIRDDKGRVLAAISKPLTVPKSVDSLLSTCQVSLFLYSDRGGL
ncbi:hypothetical protein Ddye_005995 [Dipteronia dyeriana]|uniref:Uncharacterized protein n=1 Tax=Dipteronia dyeriana TaxID=168575 RepID=A0AAD9XHR7_9ROSI|nr:hypothetical protein Ddye_005995 [Dipteronia dyeriana]